MGELARAGGPQPVQYPLVLATLDAIHQARQRGQLSPNDLDTLRRALGPAMGMGTLQGRAWLKPRGYAGDFQMIDDIYLHRCSEDPSLVHWDQFFQIQPGAKAVRNRKDFFKNLLLQCLQARPGRPLKVLNVASGPCRDVAEFLAEHPDTPVSVLCVDLDADAIAHAQALCVPHGSKVRFLRANALRLRLEERFDLVWSAGLFDYFDDAGFVALLRRLIALARPDGGQVVVGNFSDDNPSLPYQAWGEWHLAHRSRSQLRALAAACGMPEEAVAVDAEPEGVNLFLRLRSAL